MRGFLAIAGIVLWLAPAFAQSPSQRREFEVASIGMFPAAGRGLVPAGRQTVSATNVTLKMLIGLGWPGRITGGPAWVGTDGGSQIGCGAMSVTAESITNDGYR